MDRAAFEAEARIEETHWWFVARRDLFGRIIAQRGIARHAATLDLGTGTGANLRLLRDLGFGNVTGIDPSEEAARWCAEKGLGTVRKGDIRALPVADGSVDFVMATDVLEHIDDDRRAAGEIVRVLRPGGVALMTVPAFPSLWGLQDDQSHHFRRYRIGPFRRLLEQSGLEILDSYYFNYILFLPIFLARRIIALLGVKLKSENEVNTSLINAILTALFKFDVRTAPVVRPPFGVSILAVARRPAAQTVLTEPDSSNRRGA